MELRDNAGEFRNSFFGEEDETPVDMEMIKEKIDIVPLSDMDFDEPPHGVMDVDCSMSEQILAPLRLTSPEDHAKLEGSPKEEMKLQHCDYSQVENLGAVALKQVKAEATELALETGDSTASAAKVAIRIGSDVVTSGLLMEVGPPPDFSSWTVEDDILLKSAMEAGAAIEALARGAVKFSQRYTARELCERWRALLYDPDISEEAASRMLKTDSLLTNSGNLSSLNKLKYPQVSNRRRRLKSVRYHYYKKKKSKATGEDLTYLTAKDNEELASRPVDPNNESTFSEMVRLFEVDGPGELPQATALAAAAVLEAHQEEMNPIQSLACSAQLGAKTPTPLQPSNDTGHQMEAPTNEVQQSCEEQNQDDQEDFKAGGSQALLSRSNLGGLDVDMKELKTIEAVKTVGKPLIVNVPAVEHMICVLNTEDMEIPSPPSGAATHMPPLFSSSYLPSDVRSMKNERGIVGRRYGNFEMSGHGMLPLIAEDKRAVSSVIKQEPMLEGLEKHTAKVHGSLATLHANAAGLAACRSNVNEAVDSLEGSKVLVAGSLLSTLHDGETSGDVSAIANLSSLHGEVPGSTKELCLPSQGVIFSPMDQALCFTDQTFDAPTGRRIIAGFEEHEDGLGSDEEMPSFSDVEAMILDMDLDPAFDEDALARAESRRLYRRHRKTLMRLEQGANAAMERALSFRGAIAVFYGQYLRYYVTKNEVLLGRMTLDNIVDIDLGKEGRANKVSRRQATIKLKEDGVFYLKNIGRRDLCVNNIAIASGQHASLGSNCLIEVGGMRFIFEINKKLVKQRVADMVSSRQHG